MVLVRRRALLAMWNVASSYYIVNGHVDRQLNEENEGREMESFVFDSARVRARLRMPV